MVNIHLSYTAPVNPPGIEPVLSQARVFAGLQRKVRQPWEFVPAIESSEMLSEEGNVVTRLVKFKPGEGPERVVKEMCTIYAPSRVDYQLDDGSSVLNIISAGPSGRADDLFLTFVFDWKHDGMEEGSLALRMAEE